MTDIPKSEPQKLKVFDLEDTSIETIYSNTTHIIVGESDVAIYFGFQPIEGNHVPASDVKRIAMTHDSFMRMMEFWATRYRLLESLYDGKPKTLRDIDPNVVNAAFDTMLGRAREEASEEVSKNETTDSA